MYISIINEDNSISVQRRENFNEKTFQLFMNEISDVREFNFNDYITPENAHLYEFSGNGVKLKQKSIDELIVENQVNAKLTRDSAISNYVGEIIFQGVSYQSSERSKKDITDTLEGAAIKEMPDTANRPWRLSDNSYRNTSIQELREILVLVKTDILNHKLAVWDAFTEWDKGDRSEPFAINNLQ